MNNKSSKKVREYFDKCLVQKLKFKKHTFSDGSEYWFERSFKFPVFGNLDAVVDTEKGIMTLEVNSKNNKKSVDYVEYASVDYKVKNINDVNKVLRKNIKF